MSQSKVSVPLPAPGTVFLFPLPNGLWSACRVLRHTTQEESKRIGAPMWVVAGSAWAGEAEPDLYDERLREVLVLTHHKWQKQRHILWQEGSPPEEFRALGTLPVTDEDTDETGTGHSGWQAYPVQAWLQWRWDHERDAVLAEDAVQEAQRQVAIAAAPENYRKQLARLTLQGLLKKRRFTGWRGYVPKPLLQACRDYFQTAIEALIALGPSPSVRARIRILRECIRRLNSLDEQNSHFISTIEREDLCAAFDEIVYACGLHNCPDLADRWRDW